MKLSSAGEWEALKLPVVHFMPLFNMKGGLKLVVYSNS